MSATVESRKQNRPVLNRQVLLKLGVFLCALAPFALLVQSLLTGQLGPNPIDTLTDQTGELAIRFLLISLALTPLRWILNNTWPIRLRRMLGLFAFFYAFLHVTVYFGLDQQLDLTAIWDDLVERPFILAGTVAFTILIPLAITSNKKLTRRLGKRWLSLHRWIYIAGAAAVIHYIWLAKGDLIEPFVYLAILMLLLSYRLVQVLK